MPERATVAAPGERARRHLDRVRTPSPRGGTPPGTAYPAQRAGLRTRRRSRVRRTYWPSLPGLASSAGDGGRSCIPLRDSSGLTPDSLSCPRALRRHRDLRGSSRSRRRTNCTVDSRGLGSSEETPDLRTRLFCRVCGADRTGSQHSQNSPTHTTELRRFSLFPSRRVLHTLRTSPGRSVASRPSSSTRRRHNRRTSS